VRPLRKAVDLARVEQGTAEARHVVDERCEERDRLLSGLWHIEKIAEQRDSMIGQLNYALEQAAAHVSDRDKSLAEREALVAELRRALAYAESLAFERQDELTRIRASWAWPVFHRLMRLSARAAA
jgi:DNA-binding transcriptional regulator PaaX